VNVEVRYPLSAEEKSGPRENWSWLSGWVMADCGDDEWQICVEDDRVAEEEDGEIWYPVCYRDSSEIRRPVLSQSGCYHAALPKTFSK